MLDSGLIVFIQVDQLVYHKLLDKIRSNSIPHIHTILVFSTVDLSLIFSNSYKVGIPIFLIPYKATRFFFFTTR